MPRDRSALVVRPLPANETSLGAAREDVAEEVETQAAMTITAYSVVNTTSIHTFSCVSTSY